MKRVHVGDRGAALEACHFGACAARHCGGLTQKEVFGVCCEQSRLSSSSGLAGLGADSRRMNLVLCLSVTSWEAGLARPY